MLHLPLLTSLELGFSDDAAVECPRVLKALQQCTLLTELRLWGGRDFGTFHFTSEQLTTVLQGMPHLQSLHVVDTRQLKSLSFLAAGSLPETLKELQLDDCGEQIPSTELCHLHQLRALQSLSLHANCFDKPLDAATLALYQPPSVLMPSLQSFEYEEWSHTTCSAAVVPAGSVCICCSVTHSPRLQRLLGVFRVTTHAQSVVLVHCSRFPLSHCDAITPCMCIWLYRHGDTSCHYRDSDGFSNFHRD